MSKMKIAGYANSEHSDGVALHGLPNLDLHCSGSNIRILKMSFLGKKKFNFADIASVVPIFCTLRVIVIFARKVS